MFYHPDHEVNKKIREFRKRNKGAQAISCGIRRRPSSGRSPGPGQTSSDKQQANSEASSSSSLNPQAASDKPQAPDAVVQGSSRKHQAP